MTPRGFGFLFLGVVGLLASPGRALAQYPPAPIWSRGISVEPWSQKECLDRARRALQAEGYTIDWSAYDAQHGYKGMHSAIILCDDGPQGKIVVNIIVSSGGSDGNVPGRERDRLGDQLGRLGPGVPPPPPPMPPPPPPPPPPPAGCALPQLGGTYNSGYPRPATIQQAGTRFTIDNGYGEVVEGVWENCMIVVRQPSRTGEIAKGDPCKIEWKPNATSWRREPCNEPTTADLDQPAAGKPCDVAGTWFYHGDRNWPAASIVRQGNAFRLDNGQGSVSRGRLEKGTLIADDWSVTGTFAENGCRIDWSNNSWWIQFR